MGQAGTHLIVEKLFDNAEHTIFITFEACKRVLGIQDICHFTSRDIGYDQFYFQGYRILCSIFWLLSGTLNIQESLLWGYLPVYKGYMHVYF